MGPSRRILNGWASGAACEVVVRFEVFEGFCLAELYFARFDHFECFQLRFDLHFELFLNFCLVSKLN